MIAPPATIGVLGGGQLGRYFVLAARTMGYSTVVLDPDRDAPAGVVADRHVVAAYEDEHALADLAECCAVVTTEFENPPATTMEWLAKHVEVRPSADAVAIAQDRRAEKAFVERAGIPIAPYFVIETDRHVADATDFTYPAILKTARLGYDGKGQVAVSSPTELRSAWNALDHQPCVLEQRLHLDAEVSVVLARSVAGEIAAYPVAANTHVDGILDCTAVPYGAPGASALAAQIATALDYVGVLAVEMFVVDGQLLVNELAPRPHNSGHWTLDAARTSQFEQQVRAICGAGLGDPSLTAPAVVMVNLLGDLWAHGEPRWETALANPQASLHLYGKSMARPGRKMGHLTVTADTTTDAERLARALRTGLLAR
ncbi:MAG TPA: 5-(carboxyamino)imidazole ribonucleotide synthase [Ilumatobacteraceae bacterium]|nr:5-(carboxyamino)imidazole ribonucleotide synthase [Ilumatobacteraceae bacterium]